MIVGTVTGATVCRHPAFIVRHFGFRALGRCVAALLSRQPRTFLSLAGVLPGTDKACGR